MIEVRFTTGVGNISLRLLVQAGSGPPSHLSNGFPGEGVISPEVKRPGREADHSPPSSAEVRNAWTYTSTALICVHGVVLS